MMTERDTLVIRTANYVIQRNVYRLPVNIISVCCSYGIRLLPASEYIIRGMNPQILFGTWGNPDGSAVSLGDNHVINYNDMAPENRQRFTLAEELMHILLGHTKDHRFNAFAQTYPEEVYMQYESEAKHGAGMILVPPSVYFKYRAIYGLDQIAKLCRVSHACAYTVARYYDQNEAYLREHFTHKYIDCQTERMIPKRSYRPLDVWPANGVAF